MLWVGRLHAPDYFTIEQINPLNWTLPATASHHQLLPNNSPLYIASFLYWPFLVNISVKFLAELVKSSKWPPLSFELFMELNWTENTCWSDIKCQVRSEIRREESQQPLVKRKIMSLLSPLTSQLGTSQRLTNLPFLAMQKTFDVNV